MVRCGIGWNGQQVFYVAAGAVTQVGKGITQRLEQRNTRVMDIVIRPELTPQVLDILQSFLAQQGIIAGRVVLGMFFYGNALLQMILFNLKTLVHMLPAVAPARVLQV